MNEGQEVYGADRICPETGARLVWIDGAYMREEDAEIERQRLVALADWEREQVICAERRDVNGNPR